MRRIIKTKQVMAWRHRRCVERRMLVAGFISDFMSKAFIPRAVRSLYATAPSLYVPSASP